MMNVSSLLKASDLSNDIDSPAVYSLLAASCNWRAVFVASNALEFLCSCAVKLMALDRMSILLEHGMRLGLVIGGRVVMGMAAAGCAAVLGGNVAAAAYFQTASNSLYVSHTLPPHARNG